MMFKHKWKILIFTVVGLVAGGAVYYFRVPVYESRAKLLVRYVVERNLVDSVEGTTRANSDSSINLLNTETEILTSGDLAMDVAGAIGPDKLLPGEKNPTVTAAASMISLGLKVIPVRGSNVIFVSYSNRDPALATRVLDILVERYFVKHLEVHRSATEFEVVRQQTEKFRTDLKTADEELEKAKTDGRNLFSRRQRLIPDQRARYHAATTPGGGSGTRGTIGAAARKWSGHRSAKPAQKRRDRIPRQATPRRLVRRRRMLLPRLPIRQVPPQRLMLSRR
jgi:uncharacterized protein involved in exopolysaccharide biosynthesis